MSDPQTLTKQPSESRIYTFRFKRLIPPGESIATILSVSQERIDGEGDVTLGQQTFDGADAQIRISGGTDGALHKLTCIVRDTAGNELETEGFLRIKDL
jgi:hypothetical protein